LEGATDGVGSAKGIVADSEEATGDADAQLGECVVETVREDGEEHKEVASFVVETVHKGGVGLEQEIVTDSEGATDGVGSAKEIVVDSEEATGNEDAQLGAGAEDADRVGRGTRDILAEIDREKRERKATKSDNAEVPEYLWEEHLLADSPTPWVVAERTKLRKAIRMLRTCMLRWWKNKVITAFISWVAYRYPELKQIGDVFPAKVQRAKARYRWENSSQGLAE
jgi:hypothetical protein